ncbi:hypothetical protein L2E82_33493 [Cichorium intybus]|uniref:Uncharacterized protein n=1 Tax=Cichorium intybus TaxID=13427 RepID=A0ACB9BKB8_CICIN|nr:hypothetical protein L2E82_33493 [Cichorium intybus]
MNKKPGRPRIHEPDDHVVEYVGIQQESQDIVSETQGAETQDSKSQARIKDLKDAKYTDAEIEEALSMEEKKGIEET